MAFQTRAMMLARTIARAVRLDAEWQGKAPGDDRRYTDWMPFQAYRTVALFAEAAAWFGETDPDRADITALEIGCGPGSKLLIMRDLFSWDATGFDRNGEYVAAARSLGLKADDADAEHYQAYGRFDVIWFNRAARDPEIQARIEGKVWRDVRPGAVVICANLEAPPPGWFPVLDAWEERIGIWARPPVTAATLCRESWAGRAAAGKLTAGGQPRSCPRAPGYGRACRSRPLPGTCTRGLAGGW